MIYKNNYVSLYYVYFYLEDNEHQIPKNRIFIEGVELFIKKNNESYAYNIGFMDGRGWYKTKKRVLEFFKDCPLLIKAIKRKKLDRRNTMKIIKFYENNCILKENY